MTTTLDPISAFLASLGPAAVLDAQAERAERASAQRAKATRANRAEKREEHKQVLASVDGDREKLKTITVWVPRKRTEKLMARAFDRASLAAGGNAFHDESYDIEATDYTLEQIEVERAQHPDKEVAFAKLQGRFVQQTRSIEGFFAPKQVCITHKRPTDYYAPLGDFEWCERNEEVTREQQLAHSLAKLRAARPIRNIKEATR